MDLHHPFSTAFGPASTRDECIASAQNVYHRLLQLSPGSKVLSYDVLRVLASNQDGTEDPVKRRQLRQLFRPDAFNELSLLAFIQSCDTVYKKLRYFRASVGNSSVIDKVLEGIIDTLYGFALVLVLLSLMNFNPWPLLVSMSTLMVTFAFAVGPSASKAIEVDHMPCSMKSAKFRRTHTTFSRTSKGHRPDCWSTVCLSFLSLANKTHF